MPATLKDFVFTKDNFDEFYNILCDIEDYHTSWLNEEYAEEIAEIDWQLYCEKKKKEQHKIILKRKEHLKHRELDLRRKLLAKIGKYEPEEGEIFE